ncbi:hypothetical protein [Ruegeria arenilitoris]|uniref:hypothetical protein n=1 Tax=Ruegeria arenilitoris TaxID=1173585 RepID=UPI00147B43F7|nr:hypothetical protein [Ruegeria arenilitoris]
MNADLRFGAGYSLSQFLNTTRSWQSVDGGRVERLNILVRFGGGPAQRIRLAQIGKPEKVQDMIALTLDMPAMAR